MGGHGRGQMACPKPSRKCRRSKLWISLRTILIMYTSFETWNFLTVVFSLRRSFMAGLLRAFLVRSPHTYVVTKFCVHLLGQYIQMDIIQVFKIITYEVVVNFFSIILHNH